MFPDSSLRWKRIGGGSRVHDGDENGNVGDPLDKLIVEAERGDKGTKGRFFFFSRYFIVFPRNLNLISEKTEIGYSSLNWYFLLFSQEPDLNQTAAGTGIQKPR
jgi:hypothetical protein